MSEHTQIGQYSVTREIGRGRMGVVYLAHDARLDRPVAIQALPDPLAGDAYRLPPLAPDAPTPAPPQPPHIPGP